MIFQAWSIHLHGQWLDTLFLEALTDSGDPDAAETVRQSLIAHGYDPGIKVRLWRSIPLHEVVFCGLRPVADAQDGAH